LFVLFLLFPQWHYNCKESGKLQEIALPSTCEILIKGEDFSMKRATWWMLAVTIAVTAGVSAFALETANQPIVVSRNGTDQGSYADRADAAEPAAIEASFLRLRAVSASPHYDGMPENLRAGVGLPY
jgi:hypothetical protein